MKGASLHVVDGRAFLGVHPRRDGLLLNIVTGDRIESDRLKRSERVSANRVHIEVYVRAPKEIDDEVVGWLAEAYRLTLELRAWRPGTVAQQRGPGVNGVRRGCRSEADERRRNGGSHTPTSVGLIQTTS